MDIGDGSSVEIVDYFCHLGDMFSVDGDADAAVTARIRSGWFKFKFAGLFLTAKHVSRLLYSILPGCCQEKFMMHVYGIVCYMAVTRGH